MDPGSVASALIAARIGQAQLAMAARLAREESGDTAQITKLIAAAHQSGEVLTSAVQTGIGKVADFSV